MEGIPNHVKFEVLQYLKIISFINICIVSKTYVNLCKEYLKAKKGEFQTNKTKKTIHNCLYRITSASYTPPKGKEFSYKIWLRKNPINDTIVKIMKQVPDPDEPTKIKITYWVLSKMAMIGKDSSGRQVKKRYCIYPKWSKIDRLEDKDFIPFY